MIWELWRILGGVKFNGVWIGMLCCIGKSSCLIWFDLDVYTGWYMLKKHAFNRVIHGTKDDQTGVHMAMLWPWLTQVTAGEKAHGSLVRTYKCHEFSWSTYGNGHLSRKSQEMNQQHCLNKFMAELLPGLLHTQAKLKWLLQGIYRRIQDALCLVNGWRGPACDTGFRFRCFQLISNHRWRFHHASWVLNLWGPPRI
jgi:hypothetical protein